MKMTTDNTNIYQLLPTAGIDTAIWHDVSELNKIIVDMGYKTEIFAENIEPRLKKTVKNYTGLHCKKDDIVMYHYSTGSIVNEFVRKLNTKKMLIYHNITPGHFFETFDEKLKNLVESGRKELKYFVDKIDICLADSEYNRKELLDNGFNNVYVLPIIIDFEKYRNTPSNPSIKFNDGFKNFLFIGRIAPNKKIEDVIKVFFTYKTTIDNKARLIIVGSYVENEYKKYFYMLNGFVNSLNLDNVIFTDRINFRDMVSIYRQADVFMTMSEHEGLCVPLIESMLFGVPIVAYNAAAVPETLGGSGILVEKKKYVEIAELINILFNNQNLRNEVVNTQYKRLKQFNKDILTNKFVTYLNMLIN